MAETATCSTIVWFERLALDDVPIVGGKNASLGELIRQLGDAGVRVPNGFATTAQAFRDFITLSGIEPAMRDHIEHYRKEAVTLQDTGHALRTLILASSLPDALVEDVCGAYAELAKRTALQDPAVAVRSSATAEDLPDASFAGQHETFLNIRGEKALLDACLRCFASLYTDRAISYREAKGFDHFSVALSVGVQQMVRADLAGSGVMFSIDTETGFPGVATISAAWGLGETIVQGAVNPDRFVVFKPLLEQPGACPIIEKTLGDKAIRMVYSKEGGQQTKLVETTEAERGAFVLNDEEIIELARWAVAVERHYGRPMDLEWAKDGDDGLLYLVQARPETVHGGKIGNNFRHYVLETNEQPIVSGVAIG
ncbi:MAG: phosphoenolpyruvate synthase, partial [Sphingorhabdus sp.]|uniref:PEP/pyruvate-binding domain-containing protein n=1 Tax=Sphingorhabdus sp. TaxID=1902408 RepID=UPI0025D5CD3E